MVEYKSLKIPKEKIRNLERALKAKGINSRTETEAVNIIIDAFILDSGINFNEETKAKVTL